jgi:hypothetical protein
VALSNGYGDHVRADTGIDHDRRFQLAVRGDHSDHIIVFYPE